MGPRTVAALLFLSVPAACTSNPSGDPATTGSAAETSAPLQVIAYDNTSSQVLVQIGNYEFGNNLDQFVFGPRLVIYGDGSAFAEVDGDGVRNGATVFRPIESRVSEAEIQSLLLAASQLPDVATAGVAPEDGLPLLLAVNGQSWEILDFDVEPFNGYVDSVTAVVTASEVGMWTPPAWIQRIPPAPDCESVVEPEGAPYYSAPVYPHLVNTYPLGRFEC